MAQRRGRVRVEDGAKWVRVYLGGVPVADSRRVKLVWEAPYFPTYWFPAEDVRMDLLVPTGGTKRSPSRGTAALHTVEVGDREAVEAARVWTETKLEGLDGYVSFVWEAMDHWFEEDEEVFVHARDPYTRIDVLQSSRHVQVRVGGVKVADSRKPRLLFETGLPVRYYLPKTDVRLDLLEPSATRTNCPYKGEARYWSLRTPDGLVEDVAWEYPSPLLESIGIAGYVAFWDEKVDVVVDGEPQERPKTPWA